MLTLALKQIILIAAITTTNLYSGLVLELFWKIFAFDDFIFDFIIVIYPPVSLKPF